MRPWSKKPTLLLNCFANGVNSGQLLPQKFHSLIIMYSGDNLEVIGSVIMYKLISSVNDQMFMLRSLQACSKICVYVSLWSLLGMCKNLTDQDQKR